MHCLHHYLVIVYQLVETQAGMKCTVKLQYMYHLLYYLGG